MFEQFEVRGGPKDGELVALDKGHNEEVIFMEGKIKHVYRTIVRYPKDGSQAGIRRKLVYVGPNPFN